MKNTTLLISILFSLFVGYPTYAGQLANQQRQKVEQTLEAHQEAVNEIVTEFVDQPAKAQDQACLDNLMGIDFGVFVVDPSNIWGGLLDNLLDQLMSSVCNAAEDTWNGAVNAVAGDMTLPYDLGGVTITTQSNSADWGVTPQQNLELPQSDVDTFTASVDELGNVNTDEPDPDVTGLGANIQPPSWGATNQTLSDDMQQAFGDMFF